MYAGGATRAATPRMGFQARLSIRGCRLALITSWEGVCGLYVQRGGDGDITRHEGAERGEASRVKLAVNERRTQHRSVQVGWTLKSLHVQLPTTHARYTISMSVSKVLSSDSNEHSTPLSSNKERRRGANAPLMRSLSVPDNADNNDQLSARQSSPTVSRGLISCSVVVASSKMCLVKPPSAQAPSPTATSSSKNTRRPSVTFQQHQQESQDKEQHHRVESQRPLSPGTLARDGIKVRDFAYESNLPLLPSIPRVRQLVIGPRPLKRTKRYFEQSDDDIFTADTHSQSQSAASSQESEPHESVNKPKTLERKLTEPIIFPERMSRRPYRDIGYADLSQHPSSSQTAQRSPHCTLTPVLPTATSTFSFSPTPLPFPFPATKRFTAGGSQESATPNGSLTWPAITSDMPASQLDDNSSQIPLLVQDATNSQSDTGVEDSTAVGSPLSTEPATSPLQPRIDHLDGDDDDDARISPPPSPTPRTRAAHRSLTGPTPNADAAPRYFLRKHGSPGRDRAPESPPSPHRRRRPPTKAPAPYPRRVPPATRQAAHAAVSGSSGRSPRARPLRKSKIS
ncbi:hypothetical protein BC827DRAFT_767552 [Russula dissimulans]|nr:hypothetical protein BC827DRAFT_767552 [Russula dissimulans]